MLEGQAWGMEAEEPVQPPALRRAHSLTPGPSPTSTDAGVQARNPSGRAEG